MEEHEKMNRKDMSEENTAESTAEHVEQDIATSREEQLELELREMKDKYTRLHADFDNARKRHARERLDLIQTASAGVIKELLSVMDDFERAEQAIKASGDSSALEGISLIHHRMQRVLEGNGLKAMDALHTPFDTEFHEAITNIPAPSDDLKGKVVDVVEKGYFIHDTVIRYAKVIVGQ
jgi:molecular chaperone GrpE